MSSMSVHHGADELVGLVGHPAFDAAVDRAARGLLVLVLDRVRHRFGEVGGERLDHAGLRLRTRDRHVDRVRVLLAVEAPAAGPHEVVDVVDVELVAREAEAERRVRPMMRSSGCERTASCIANAVSKIRRAYSR